MEKMVYQPAWLSAVHREADNVHLHIAVVAFSVAP